MSALDSLIVRSLIVAIREEREAKKRFRETENVGKARYVVSFHDGVKKHPDGSDFFDVRIFPNKLLKARFLHSLVKLGYRRDA